MSNDEKEEENKKEKKTWGEIAKELIRRLKRTKFLAITATPERDADGEDPMLEFADTARYTETELRKRDYLASDMALVSALEDGLVVKPDVVTFDCMLDRTKEYQEIEEKLLNAIQKSKQKDTITKKINAKTGKMEIVDDYHALLLNFLKMNQLSGKLDFLQRNLQDKELVSAIEKLNDGSYVQENMEYFSTLEKLVKMIAQIDQVVKKIDGHKELSEEDNEIYPLAFGYYQWQEEQVEQIVSSTLSQRQYLQHGKYICFTPTSPSKEQTPELMRSYQKRMQHFLGIEAEDALITHSNSDVITEAEDKRNLSRFTLKREKNRPPIAMVAMNKFNEGLHVSGVVASFMFRQFTEESVALEDEKEEPKIIFLQQVGRCIHSIEPGEVVTEPPVIFDTACNFMRFNEKLNGLFQISPNQMEFKRLYDESVTLAKSKGKKQTQEGVEEDIPKPKILDRILGIMQALAENGIDIEVITNETTWEEVEARIPEERREEVLDGIFVMTRKRMRPDYPIGSRIASARAAFWHTERQNPQSKSIKKLYNSKTDAFFAGKTFEELYQLGFFKDLEKTREFSKVSKEGFIIGECATPESFYGFNILTGTRYTKEYPEYGIPGVDVRGFSKAGIHIKTGIRYDEHFFRFDQRSGEWKNFFTGKDEDLLGFNHDGIRVNPEKGRVGFDRDRLWHKQLEDGSYSPLGSLYDEGGRDAFGFDRNNKAPDGTEYINGFMRIKRKDGTLSYLFRSGGSTDYDGYTIDGFDDKGFNREGIHRETGCRFDPTGMTIDKNNPKRRETYFPIKRIVEGKFLVNEPDSKKRELITQRMLTQWIVLSQAYSKDMEQAEWYRVLKIKELQDRVRSMSNENSISQRILVEENTQTIQEKNETLQRQMEETEKLIEERNAKKAEISKLTSILQKIIQKREEDGGQEL